MATFTENDNNKKTIRSYVLDYEADRLFYLSDLALSRYKELTGKEINNDGYSIYQDDPYLIQILEELGSEGASGDGSLLRLCNVKEGTIGIVYNPMRPQLYLTSDAKKLFKELSGYEYSDNVPRHDKHLVQVYEKMGDRASCYPIDFIEIDYIPEDEINSYEIIRENDFEEVIFSGNRKKIIYGIYYSKGMFEESLHAISFNKYTLENMISEINEDEDDEEEKEKYSVKEVDLFQLKDIYEQDYFQDNDYPFLVKCSDITSLKLCENNFYGFIRNIEKEFPIEIHEKNGDQHNSTLKIFVEEEILLYIDNNSNLELLQSIKKYNKDLSLNNIELNKYYSNGIVNKI
jgi:hypothetical protein